MGVFDTIVCECPLEPSEVVHRDGFQTKSMECELSRYVLDAKGVLWQTHRCDPMEGEGVALPEPVGKWLDSEIEIHDYIDGVLYSYVLSFVRGHLESVKRACVREV